MRMRLADVGTWRSGGTPPKDQDHLWAGDFPWISSRDLKRSELGRSELTIAKDAAHRFSTVVPAGSLLIATRGMALAKRLPVGIATRPVAFNQDVRAIVPHAGVAPKYLLYAVLASEKPILALADEAAHGTKRLETDLLRAFRISLPSPDEQRTIADFLDAETARIDAVVRQRARQADLLVERQRAVCRRLVTGGSTPYPVGPLRRWWSVIDCKHRTPEYVETGIPLVSTGEVHQGRLDLSRTARYVSRDDYEDLAASPRRPRRGDIVYSRNASLGAAAYVDTDEEFCMGQDVCLIRSEGQDQRFLAYALDLVARTELDARSIGSTFKRINVDQIKDLLVPHPSPAQQREIAQVCGRLDRATAHVLAAIDRQMTLLRERRQALITAAVTGRLKVPEAATTNAKA